MRNLEPREEINDRAAASCQGGSCGWGAWWRLPLLLGIVLAGILFVNGRGIRQPIPGVDDRSAAPAADNEGARPPESTATARAKASVSLAVDFGDGRRREWNSIEWRDGMTIADALTAAARAEKSGEALSFIQQGTGASAFLTQFGDIANEGAGRRNWTYSVNGERGDRSFAIYALRPGDQVLWKFDVPR